MNRSLFLSALSVVALAACNQERSPEPVDAVQDMTAGVVGQTSAATVGANMQSAYIPGAAVGDMYEIQSADIALERSQNAEIKSLARMIKADHTAASNALKSMLPEAAPDASLPTELDERRQGMIDNLRSASAANFDTTYLNQQIAAHQEALTLHRGFADQDSPLAAHAQSVVPKIEAHLQKAEEIKGGM